MILVTGATGTVGSWVVSGLVARGARVRALTRDPRKAVGFGRDVLCVVGDFDDATSLARAVDGVEAVFLLDAPGASVPRHDLAVIGAAKAEGVRKLVKLSGIMTASSSPAGTWHQPGEAAVRESGCEWTILRPGSFASNTLRWAPAIRAHAPVPIPTADGKQSVIDPRDIAAVAVEALLTPGHGGKTYTLTGPGLLTGHEQAQVLARVLGVAIRTVDVSIEEARSGLITAGASPEFAEAAAVGFAHIRAGGSAVLTGDVEAVLRRPPGTFEQWARAAAPQFGVTADREGAPS